MAMTLSELARAMGGELLSGDPSTLVSGDAQTDSREIERGDIFFARRGETTDGHRFTVQAVAQGAAALVVERKVDGNAPQILVDDATLALGRLAGVSVRRLKANGSLTVVGVTGSNGKTTSKNLIEMMAQRIGSTVASAKSFNNEVGGPITMLRANEDTRTLITEMGASAEGEIARLSRMALPDIGVVLAVGLAHAGGFGDIETTFRTKSEMVRDLPEEAVAVLNADDPWVARMAELTRARVVFFGQSEAAEVRATGIEAGREGTMFTLHARGESVAVRFGVLGEHHVSNALAAAAVSLELGLTLAEIGEVLASTRLAAPGRMQVIACRDGVTVINDAYNANPDSMSAALKTLAQLKVTHTRAIAVLGPMSELGEISGEQHDRIGLQAVRLGIDQLVVIGSAARRLHISAINEGSWDGESVFFEDQGSALAHLLDTVQAGDTVLVKASNAAGLHAFADRLGRELS